MLYKRRQKILGIWLGRNSRICVVHNEESNDNMLRIRLDIETAIDTKSLSSSCIRICFTGSIGGHIEIKLNSGDIESGNFSLGEGKREKSLTTYDTAELQMTWKHSDIW